MPRGCREERRGSVADIHPPSPVSGCPNGGSARTRLYRWQASEASETVGLAARRSDLSSSFRHRLASLPDPVTVLVTPGCMQARAGTRRPTDPRRMGPWEACFRVGRAVLCGAKAAVGETAGTVSALLRVCLCFRSRAWDLGPDRRGIHLKGAEGSLHHRIAGALQTRPPWAPDRRPRSLQRRPSAQCRMTGPIPIGSNRTCKDARCRRASRAARRGYPARPRAMTAGALARRRRDP